MQNTSASSEASREVAPPPLLQRLVSAGRLRYWIIASWAVALATELPLLEVGIWFAVTMAFGITRSVVEARVRARPDGGAGPILWVATISCVAWAAAPVMAMLHGRAEGAMLAVALLCAGYMLVFTQMRAAPREALIVSSPYTVALIFIVSSLAGTPGYATMLGICPVIGLALLIKVVVTQLKDAEISRSAERQDLLIRELEVARDRADAASQAKSNFLGVISHELRTPMNGVLGAAQLLSGGRLEPQQREFVSIIQQSGESLLTLLNDILDITKIEAGKMEMTICEITVPDLVRKVVGPFQAHAEAKGLAFDISCDAALPHRIRTDPLRLSQVVQNFLSNAIKFTSDGGIRLSISVEDAPSDTQTQLVFSVSDEGVGIAEGDLTRLFQPFTQVDDSSTRRFAGTGLGLSIAKRMAELLDGEVQVQSTLGAGSVFTVRLTVDVVEWDDPAWGVDLAEGADAQLEARALRVLIAEDHPVNRLVLQAFLLPLGHEITLTGNGREACEQAGAQSFDLIFMDVNMPVMDGLTATRTIRESEGPNRDTPIAILSASARGEDHMRGLQAGADAYLDKPVDFSAVAEVLMIAAGGRDAFTSPLQSVESLTMAEVA